jgi:hypothetical protein
MSTCSARYTLLMVVFVYSHICTVQDTESYSIKNMPLPTKQKLKIIGISILGLAMLICFGFIGKKVYDHYDTIRTSILNWRMGSIERDTLIRQIDVLGAEVSERSEIRPGITDAERIASIYAVRSHIESLVKHNRMLKIRCDRQDNVITLLKREALYNQSHGDEFDYLEHFIKDELPIVYRIKAACRDTGQVGRADPVREFELFMLQKSLNNAEQPVVSKNVKKPKTASAGDITPRSPSTVGSPRALGSKSVLNLFTEPHGKDKKKN